MGTAAAPQRPDDPRGVSQPHQVAHGTGVTYIRESAPPVPSEPTFLYSSALSSSRFRDDVWPLPERPCQQSL